MDENLVIGTAPESAAPVTPTEPAQTKGVDEAPDPKALESEIERLNKVREKAEEDAKYWRQQKVAARADFFKGRAEEPPPKPAETGPLPPRKEDFDDYDKYVDALTTYKTEKKLSEWRRDEERRQADTQRQAKVAGLQEKLNAGYQKYPDFEEVALDPTVPITQTVHDLLAESEAPEDVAYYLGKNRAEAVRIARLTPIQAAREIVRIEAEMKNTNPNPTNKKVTGAPPPIKPVGSNPTTSKPLEKMNQKEFEAEMQKRTGRRF